MPAVAPGPVRAPLWLLALITFSGTLAMHIFVPALPLAAVDLGASAGSLQITVSVYIFGLAVGQLLYGPLSDRLGRRPTLMVGLFLYTLSGLAAAFAPTVRLLIVARLFQALGGCAGMVLGRAIVRDTALPAETARRLALMNLMVTIGPGVAPLIGGALAAIMGWRAIFIVLCAFGIVNLIFAWRLLPETGGPALRHDVSAILRNYRKLFVSPAFLGYSIGGGCATTSMYAFVGAAPFIFVNQLHRPSHEVGIYLAIMVSGMWLGSVVASRLATRVVIGRLLVRANLLSFAAAAVFLGGVLSGYLTVPLTVISMFVFTFGVGTVAPAALAEAISVNPYVIGSASGLYGFTQMAVGAVCTALAGIGSDPALSAAIVLTAAGVVGQFSFWVAIRAMRAQDVANVASATDRPRG
jgi:DHA1 family bicyclomycin/chloramphenicol resistance-like MFS transporter